MMSTRFADLKEVPLNKWIALVVLAGLVGYYLISLRPTVWTLDDAFISFRYARNLINGNGLVFNVGQRVEGYTNFLWIILLSGLWKSGLDIVATSRVLGMVFAAGTIVLTYELSAALHRREHDFLDLLAPSILVFYPGFAFWTVSGMETLMFTFLITLATYCYLRDADNILVPIILALGTMTRPEGTIFFGVLLVDRWFSKRGMKRRDFLWVASFLIIYLPYYLWRWNYYGWPLPNTFYAKVGYTPWQVLRGLRYFGEFLWQGGGILFVVLACISGASWRERNLRGIYVSLLLYTLYVILVGGDFYFGHRFLIPILPTLFALGVGGIRLIVTKHRIRPFLRPLPLVAVLLHMVLLVSGTRPYMKENVHFNNKLTTYGTVAAQLISSVSAPDDIIAAEAIGAIGFYMDAEIIDLYGLTDERIGHRHIETMGARAAGHEKYDTQYVLSKSPDFIFLLRPTITQLFADISYTGHLPADRDMLKNETFRDNYVWVGVGSPSWVGYYARKRPET